MTDTNTKSDFHRVIDALEHIPGLEIAAVDSVANDADSIFDPANHGDAFAYVSARHVERVEVEASLIDSADAMRGFVLIYPADTVTSAESLSPNIMLRSKNEVALLYLADGDGAAVENVAKTLRSRATKYSVGSGVPLPGLAWSLEAVCDDAPYTVAEIENALLGGSGSSADNDGDDGVTSIEDAFARGVKFYDANVTGELVAGVLDHPFVGSVLAHHKSVKAANVIGTVRKLYRHIAEHQEGEKEGLGFTACHLADDAETGKPRRKKRNVETNGAFLFDFDGGETTEEILGKFEAMGASFGAYSSYNHLRTPGVHKLRVVLPFENPFAPDHYGDRENYSAAVWRASFESFCERHDLNPDGNARDITRFMNSPRHPAGGQFFSRIHLGPLYRMEVVQPEELPIAKRAKTAGVTLSYDTSGEAYVADGNGVEFFLSLIGDSPDQLGFHNPIYRVLCSYFSPANGGPDVDAGPIVRRLRLTIEKAKKGPGRAQSDIGRYMSDDYLSAEIDNARKFIRERMEAKEAAGQASNERFDALLASAEAEKASDGVISAATNDALIDRIASADAPSNAMHLVKARLKIGITDFRKQVESRRKNLRKEKKGRKANMIFASDGFGVQCEILASALAARNDREPALFNFGGAASRLIESVDHKGPRMILTTMNRDGFESECNDTVTFFNDKDSGDGPALDESLPLPIVKKVWNLAVRDYLLPLRRLVASPIHATDGSLITTAGYARNVCALFDIGDLSIPSVSAVTPPAELARAKELILTDVLGDWCFADDFGGDPRPGIASKAHAVALLLQPFARELYSGCTPGFLIDKPSPGSGASFLVDVIHRISHGRPAAFGAFPETEEETRKGLTAKVQAGVAMIVYDNVRRKFVGDSSSMFLTAEVYSDRILGETRIGAFPNLGVMVITGNNVSLADENVRRFLPIRLDPRMPESELEGREFSKPDLDTWVIENRGDLIWACLTLIQNWIAKGRNPGKLGFKSYENFAKVMGGILDAAGIEGFMENVNTFRASKRVENLEDTDFMQALFNGLQTKDKNGNIPAVSGFTAAAAHHIVFDTAGICRFAHLNIKVDRDDEHKQKQALGTRLEKRLNTYTLADGTYRFEKMAEQKDGSNQYRFVQIKAKPAPDLTV